MPLQLQFWRLRRMSISSQVFHSSCDYPYPESFFQVDNSQLFSHSCLSLHLMAVLVSEPNWRSSCCCMLASNMPNRPQLRSFPLQEPMGIRLSSVSARTSRLCCGCSRLCRPRVEKDATGEPIVHEYLASSSHAHDVFYSVQTSQTSFPKLLKHFVIIGHSQGGSAAWLQRGRLSNLFRDTWVLLQCLQRPRWFMSQCQSVVFPE